MGGYGNNGENVSIKIFLAFDLYSTKIIFAFKDHVILISKNYVCRIKMNQPQYSKSKRACKRKQNDLKRMEIILTISCNDEPLDKLESNLFLPQWTQLAFTSYTSWCISNEDLINTYKPFKLFKIWVMMFF